MGNKQSNNNKVLQPKETVKEKAYKVEREILSNSGLKIDEEIYIDDVCFDYFGQNYLHTIRCGRPEEKIQNHIVILHGYQGSSITFYKLLRHLYPQYNVYCPDIIGMALSSRPVVAFQSTQEWLDFFVEAIERWREKLNIDKFHFIGHSLGGYFASLYSMKYPQNITKLTLLSPAGITDVSKGGSINEKMPFGKKVGFAMLGAVWGLKLTMKGVYDNPMSRLIMKPSLRKRYEVSKEEGELLAKLTELSFQYPKDLDEAIYYIFRNPIPNVRFPIEDKIFEEVKSFKIDFYFGAEDWMDQAGSIRLCERDNNRFKMFIISKNGHNFNLENADELGNSFLENNKLGDDLHEINHLGLDDKIEVKFDNPDIINK